MSENVYEEMDQESGARLVKITPFPAGHPLREKAMLREKARKAGTHAFHHKHGLCTREKAEALVRDGRAKRSEFLGHPETGKVAWEGFNVVEPEIAESYPTGPDDEVDAATLATLGVGATSSSSPPPIPGAVEIKRKYFIATGPMGDEPSERAYDGKALKAMVASGELTRSTRVFAAGMGSWTPAGETHELGPLFPPPPIPKATTPAPAPSSDASKPAA